MTPAEELRRKALLMEQAAELLTADAKHRREEAEKLKKEARRLEGKEK